jgi:hypothetical protein
MITTHDADEAKMFATDPGSSIWRTATLTPGLNYVFINYGQKNGRSWIYQTSILWDSRDIIDFCQLFENNATAKIVDLCLLQPFRKDKTLIWRWTTVQQIRVYEGDGVEHPVYITDAGEAVGLRPEDAKQKMKPIYKARRTRTCPRT